ncbi:MAG: hypothetical protein K0Q89_15 [Thermomicrobiales bacterium]|jgi:hypothetical protein|nr:hypothetical protein [Thermomicrobiales bacterium]
MSIGQEFTDATEVIVLVAMPDGSQHAFQVEAGTVRWEWAGVTDSPTMGVGSAGRVTVEGRFYRKRRDQLNPNIQGELNQ